MHACSRRLDRRLDHDRHVHTLDIARLRLLLDRRRAAAAAQPPLYRPLYRPLYSLYRPLYRPLYRALPRAVPRAVPRAEQRLPQRPASSRWGERGPFIRNGGRAQRLWSVYPHSMTLAGGGGGADASGGVEW